MSGRLKPGLCCPMCGKSVLMVFHEWRGGEDQALFEYHHHEDAAKARRGGEPTPCTVVMPYDEGLTRYVEESAAAESTPH
jgi:hypothetical protein